MGLLSKAWVWGLGSGLNSATGGMSSGSQAFSSQAYGATGSLYSTVSWLTQFVNKIMERGNERSWLAAMFYDAIDLLSSEKRRADGFEPSSRLVENVKPQVESQVAPRRWRQLLPGSGGSARGRAGGPLSIRWLIGHAASAQRRRLLRSDWQPRLG